MATSIYTSIISDLPHFVYRELQKNKYNAKVSYISKSATQFARPRYQLTTKDEPRLRAPFGISKPYAANAKGDSEEKQQEKEEDKDRKTLCFALETGPLMDALLALDQHNKKVAHENCKKWFNKELSMDHVDFMYTPLVKYDKDKKYKPTFSTKINVNPQSDNATRFFLAEERDGMIQYVQKDSSIIIGNCQAVPIVEISSLYFGPKGFNMVLDCTDVIVFPKAKREAFPFQGWDAAAPMEVDASAQPEGGGGGSGATEPSAQAEHVAEGTSLAAQGWVPPAEPSSI